MKIFKTNNYKIDKKQDKTVIYINKTNDINYILSILYNCYSNKKTCIITDNEILNIYQNRSCDIFINYKNKNHTLNWDMLDYYNEFIKDKYIINENFNITPSIFNIFFISLIDNHFSFYNKSNKNLLGVSNSIFGIYNTYNNTIIKCKFLLYFSFSIFSFILYKVRSSYSFVAGKLIPKIKYVNNNLIISDNKFKCPASFLNIEGNKFAIKKTQIKLKLNSLANLPESSNYCNFYQSCNNHNLYFIKLDQIIDELTFNNLFKFIILKYPILNHKTNTAKYDADNMYVNGALFCLFYSSSNSKLIIQLPVFLITYINNILNAISYYLNNISLSRQIIINQYIIHDKKDKYMHLVSEMYFLTIAIIYFIPKMILNLKPNVNNGSIQLNYIFTSNEVKKLDKNKNIIFSDLKIYIKSVFIKTLGTYMYNNYCFILENNIFNIVPIFKGCSNKFILELLSRSKKADLSKQFIKGYIDTFIKQTKDKYEYPVILINISETCNFNNFKIEKIYSTDETCKIPIIINILYHNEEIYINMLCKKKYQHYKYIFDETINELIN